MSTEGFQAPQLPAGVKLTPQMLHVIERMARLKRPPMHSEGVAKARVLYEMGSGVLEVPKAELARVEDFTISARDGAALPARLYASSVERGLPLMLYLHGGGFTIGSIATHDILCRELARLSGAMVVSLDYRLSPEYQFPVATNDAWDALRWLAAHADELGADPRRLAVGGDSAGGTLAAVNAIHARDAGIPLALQLLIYPGTTAHQDTPSHQTFAHGLVLEEEAVSWYFNNYIPNHADREDWRFAPLLAPDLDDVAPAFFVLAECDPLVDEGIAYADRLRASGVRVDLEIYRGVTHEFIKMGRALPEARQAHADAARALREAFGLN